MNLADLRLNYQKGELHEAHVHPDPFAQFSIWFKEAQSAEVPEPNAMFLSTLSSSGRPSGRIVLLKTVDHGFSFFTNYESRKGQEQKPRDYHVDKAVSHREWACYQNRFPRPVKGASPRHRHGRWQEEARWGARRAR